MCLIVLAWQVHPRWPLLLVAHRDELRDRPSAALSWWDDPPILAGRDLRAGGSWLGVNREGHWAALTNVRRMPAPPAPLSRGIWIPRALVESRAILDQQLREQAGHSGAFNLLQGDRHHLRAFHSPSGQWQSVSPGVHGLSNAALDTPWPKVRNSTRRMRALLQQLAAEPLDASALWAVTADTEVPADELLPDTGIGAEWERRLAPALILGREYGTVSRSMLALGAHGEVWLREQQLDAEGRVLAQVHEAFLSGAAHRG